MPCDVHLLHLRCQNNTSDDKHPLSKKPKGYFFFQQIIVAFEDDVANYVYIILYIQCRCCTSETMHLHSNMCRKMCTAIILASTLLALISLLTWPTLVYLFFSFPTSMRPVLKLRIRHHDGSNNGGAEDPLRVLPESALCFVIIFILICNL